MYSVKLLFYRKKGSEFCLFSDWTDEAVSSHNILKLIYHGRFLHGNVSLGG